MQRRYAALLMLTLLLATALAVRGGAHADMAAPETPGDCDMDGVVTAADAAVLLRGAMGVSGFGVRASAAADVTKNDVIDTVDVRAALWIAAGRIPDPVKFVERISTGLCGEELFDRFCYTGVNDDGQGNYQSANVGVSVERRAYAGSVCFIAQIYVQDIRCFATAFSGGRFKGGNSRVTDMARQNNAVLAVNGDFCSQRDMGPIIRNGTAYSARANSDWDTCVLTYGGELLTFPYRTLDADTLAELGAYQTWVFGPELLDETGKAKTSFRSAVTAANPRTAIGYYAPGHYCFLVADGRQRGYSGGLTMQELSALCEELGLAAAYNLDGGRSSVMATRYGAISRPVAGGRAVGDIVYIREPDE